MTKDEIERARQAYVSGVREGRDNRASGLGLGLPIVRGLIDLHQGEFAIQSREGEGTRVIVTFPPERAGKRHEMPIPAVITRIPAEAA